MDTKQPMTSIGEALTTATGQLAGVSDTPWLDSQVLLAALLNKPRSWLLAHQDHKLEARVAESWQHSLQRLEKGEPLPHVIGYWEFFNLEFEVSPAVLIPRPETELLVERAIAWFQKRKLDNLPSSLLDVGTGSGCIAIAVAANVPDLEILAVDISPQALVIARRNAQRLVPGVAINFMESDLFAALAGNGSPDDMAYTPGRFHLITANLPYIPDAMLSNLRVSSHEPRLALAGGRDGLAIIHRFLKEAPHYLHQDGLILLEIEASQGEVVKSLVDECMPGAQQQLLQDLAGRDRVVEIHLNSTGEMP